MDLTRLLVPLGIFAVVFAFTMWRLRRERSQGIDPEVSLERMNRRTIRHSSIVGIVVAAVILLAGIAQANLFIILGGFALVAFQIWRRSTVS